MKKNFLKSDKFNLKLLLIIFLIFCCCMNFNSNAYDDIIQPTSNMGVSELRENGMELKDYLNKVQRVIVYCDGEVNTFVISDNEFSLILNELEYMLDDAREMPALAVSLDDSTRMEMKSGNWIELVFDEMLTHNDMPFDSLLINVVSEYTGFNLIRKYDDKFEGRCYYVDLMNGKTMKNLERILTSI